MQIRTTHMILASNFGQKIQTASSFNWNNMREIHNNSICVYIVVNKFVYRNKKNGKICFHHEQNSNVSLTVKT